MEQVCDFVVAMETCMHCVAELQDRNKQRLDTGVNARVGPGSDVTSPDMISELIHVAPLIKQMNEHSNKEHNNKTTNYLDSSTIPLHSHQSAALVRLVKLSTSLPGHSIYVYM